MWGGRDEVVDSMDWDADLFSISRPSDRDLILGRGRTTKIVFPQTKTPTALPKDGANAAPSHNRNLSLNI